MDASTTLVVDNGTGVGQGLKIPIYLIHPIFVLLLLCHHFVQNK